MTDREMLELAAKAAGIELWPDDVFTDGLAQKVNDYGILCWNPLKDDGDALRLAVKCSLVVDIGDDDLPQTEAWNWKPVIVEQFAGDPYAATRRAIVRAAAEIGKSMP